MKLSGVVKTSGLALLACAAFVGCGDNSKECGPGTRDEDGSCVATCAQGTVLVGSECVPDGSVVCQQGTKFDPVTGTCVIDPAACADGTTLVNGACVPDDDLLAAAADHREMPEPNGPGDANIAGTFPAPALGASTTFYGCVKATVDEDADGNLDADFDAWIVQASAPMVLEVTTDGIHGLSAGFVAVNADAANASTLGNYQRYGVNLTNDTAKREIYLPAAGRYAILVTDGRSLVLGGAGAGDDRTCYFATVKHVPTPAPVTLTTPQTTATDDGHVKLYRYTAAVGDILDTTVTAVGPALDTAFVSFRGAALHRSSMTGANDAQPFDTIGGLNAGEEITLVVDAELNYGASPQQFTIDSNTLHAQALSTSGGSITVTNANDAVSPLSFTELTYSYFDVTAPGVLQFQVTPSIATDMVIVRRDLFTAAGALDVVATIDAFGGTGRAAFDKELVKFLAPGRYYFVTVSSAAGGTYTIASTIAAQPTTAVTYGTPLTGQTLTSGEGLHSVDLASPVWVQFGVDTTDWGANNIEAAVYDLASEGWLRTGTGAAAAGNVFPLVAATRAVPGLTFGRITLGETRDLLVRTRPVTPAALGPAPVYSISVGDMPDVVDLGTITSGTSMQNLPSLRDTSPLQRFIAKVPTGALQISDAIVATGNVRIRRFGRNETVLSTVDGGGLGVTENLFARQGAVPDDFVAWAVNNSTVDPSTATQTVTFVPPLPFVDICATGVVLPAPFDGTADDEFVAQTIPAGSFSYFGAAAPTDLVIAANGFLAFGTANPTCSFGCFSNGAIPATTQPNGFVAPYWDDLQDVRVCRKDEAGKVTFQWSGNLFNSTTTVQFQAVLNAAGQIDFIYGPGQQANGSSATVGAENLTGTVGVLLSRDTAGSVPPSSSSSFTP